MTQCVVLCFVTLSHNMDVYSWVQLFGDHPKSTNHVERHTHPFKSSSPSVKFLNNNSRQNAQYVVDENNSNHGKLEKRLKKMFFWGKQKSSIFDDHNTFYAKLRMPEKMWINFFSNSATIIVIPCSRFALLISLLDLTTGGSDTHDSGGDVWCQDCWQDCQAEDSDPACCSNFLLDFL